MINDNSTKKILIVLFLMILFIAFNAYYFIFNLTTEDLKIIYIFINILGLFFLFNHFKKWISLMVLFYITNSIFLGGRTYLDILNYLKIERFDFFYKGQVNREIIQDTLRIMINNNLIILLIFFICDFIFNLKEKGYNFFKNKKMENFGKYLMFISIIPSFIGYLLILKKIIEKGYLSLYTEGHNFINFFRFETLFMIGYVYFINGKPNKKIFLKYSILYFFMLGTTAFTGQRGKIIVGILIWLLMYSKIYRKSISTFNFLKLGLMLITVSQLILFVRSNFKDTFKFDFLYKAFWQQSVTFQLLPLYLKSKKTLLYNFENLIYVFRDFSSRKEFIEITFEGKLSNQINSELTKKGYGLGTSYIVELYSSWGEVGVYIGTILLVLIICLFYSKVFEKTFYGRYLTFFLFQSIIFIPRSSFLGVFKIFVNISRNFLIVYILYYFYLNFNKRLSGRKIL